MEQMEIDPKTQRWGGLASFTMAVTFVIPGLIYLVGDLRTAIGALAYDLADFLFGPVWSTCLIITIFMLREKLNAYAPRRTLLALFAASLSAGAMMAVAFIRSANRNYHIMRPELHLEDSIPVLAVWTTLVAGVTAVGWHFFGWAQILIGSAGWTSRRLPRILSLLYISGGIVSLFVYLFPNGEGLAILLGMIVCIWQGFLLWNTEQITRAPSNESPLR